MNTHTHSPPVPGWQPAAPADPKLILQTVLITLRCWWKIAVPIGIVLAAAAVAGVIRLVDPTFTATAWVLIRERPDFLVSQNAFSQDPRKQLQNQLELMKSPLVLNAVLQVPGIAETPELVDEEEPVATLRRLLKVRSQNNSDYYLIEFTSTSPEQAHLIVNSVAQQFLDEQQKNNSNRIQGLINSLTELRNLQEDSVKVLRGVYESTSISQLGTNPFSLDSEENRALSKNLAAEMKSSLTVAERNCQVLSSQITAEKALVDRNDFTPLESQVEQLTRQDQQVLTEEARIASKKNDLAGYKKVAKDARLYKSLEEEIARDEANLKETVLPEVRDRIRDQVIESQRLVQQDRIKILERELEQANQDVKFFQDQLAQVQDGQLAYQGETFKVDIAKDAYDRAYNQLEAIDLRIQGMKMEQKAPPPAELFQRAEIPGAPDAELPYKQMGLAGGVAFLLPFGVAVSLEYLRRRVSNRDQLEQSGQIAVLGEVTALPRRQRSAKDLRSQRDLQLFEESIDGLRTFLTLRESMLGMKVIAVSSAVSREGKTSIAAQLAVSLASATGERTLLIDGDMRSPDVDKIFGVERGPGLADVLQGDVPIEEAIETDFNDTLHLLTAGNLTCSPHRLLGNGEFAALLSQLRASYHYIVVDTPPILPASEALVMARAADAAILCVRRDFSRLDQVAEARDRLRHSGVKTAGAVLSGIPPRIYERRYGSYYYKNKAGA